MLRTLNEIRALKDPVKQSQCEFIIQETPGMLLAKLAQKVAGALSGNKSVATAKELRLRCTSYSYPGAKVGRTKLNIMGHKRALGTIQDRSGTWKCRITEDYEGSVLNIIQAWMDLQYSPVLGTRLPSTSYATTCMILLGGSYSGGNVANTDMNGRKIILHGFYPVSISVPDIDPNSSNPVEITVEWNYDYYADNGYSLFSLGQ